ncbi:hypothetical protein ACFOMH_01570 [Paracoccus mangrovi]|uniref:Uncharacterized protein n=1 Tax=Paracoccus mangrovi TaxID=1715645 RepID=A0ABV7QZW8_9RHOB
MKFRSAFAVLSMTVALAACSELPFQTAAKPEATGHVGPPGVSPLEQPIETGAELVPVATAEASTMSTAMFRASGAGWTVTAADKNAVYERAGAKSVGVSVRRVTYARGVEFIGTMNGAVFSLNVQAQACEAGDQKTPFTARLRVGSQRLTGCAVPTDTMPKAQTRASSAAPKPKAQPKPAATTPKPPTATTSPAGESPVKVPPGTTPATGTATTPAVTTTAPATTAPATTAPAPVTTTPTTTAPATAPAAPATTAPAATGGNAVPAPALVLPPTPPAPAAGQ